MGEAIILALAHLLDAKPQSYLYSSLISMATVSTSSILQFSHSDQIFTSGKKHSISTDSNPPHYHSCFKFKEKLSFTQSYFILYCYYGETNSRADASLKMQNLKIHSIIFYYPNFPYLQFLPTDLSFVSHNSFFSTILTAALYIDFTLKPCIR